MTETFKDPVCDMDVTPETAAGKSEYKGQTYYFCSLGCKRSFDKEPEKYLGKTDEHAHHSQFASPLLCKQPVRMSGQAISMVRVGTISEYPA